MSEEDLRQQIQELKKENARLHQEKMQLLGVIADLRNRSGEESDKSKA